MVKNTLVALIAAVSIAGVAVPAFAGDAFGDTNSTEMREFLANATLTQLQQQGINATAVEDWSGLIRAFVTLEDGTQVMQFFEPGTLKQVIL